MALHRLKNFKQTIEHWRLRQYLPTLLPYVSFGLVALAFARYEWGWLSLMALVPLLMYLDYSQ